MKVSDDIVLTESPNNSKIRKELVRNVKFSFLKIPQNVQMVANLRQVV